MKRIKQILCAAAIAATVTLSGRTALASPKGDEQRPVVTTGKATSDRVAVSGSTRKDPDLLLMIKNCPLSPKMKEDSAVCKTCCAKTTHCVVAMK